MRKWKIKLTIYKERVIFVGIINSSTVTNTTQSTTFIMPITPSRWSTVQLWWPTVPTSIQKPMDTHWTVRPTPRFFHLVMQSLPKPPSTGSMNDSSALVAWNISRIMSHLGHSMKTVAQSSGITVQHLYGVMAWRNNLSPKTRERIAVTLWITVDDLVLSDENVILPENLKLDTLTERELVLVLRRVHGLLEEKWSAFRRAKEFTEKK